MTALREAHQVGSLQPTTLVCYEATIERVADCRDPDLLASHGVDEEFLADPTWRDAMRERGSARTQDFARDLIADGFAALLVRSFAPGTSSTDMNLVLWRWSDRGDAVLTLIDDEDRLSR